MGEYSDSSLLSVTCYHLLVSVTLDVTVYLDSQLDRKTRAIVVYTVSLTVPLYRWDHIQTKMYTLRRFGT